MKNIYALCLWLMLALLGGCATNHVPDRSADEGHAKTYTLVLLRHGESLWNKEDRFTGWSDVPLTEKGEAGALKADKLLKAEGFAFDQVHTSYLGRAIKTAWLTLEGMETMWLPVQKDWRLNERHYGALEGKTRKEVTETSGAQQVKIWRRSFDVPPPPMSHDDLRSPAKDPRYQAVPRQLIPQSESLKDTIARVQPYWLAELVPSIRSGKKVLVVAHSTLLRALVANFSRMSEEELQKFEIPNTVPLVFQLDENLKPVSYRILGAEKIRK